MSRSIKDRFNIGASHTIGSYLLAGAPLETIYENVHQRVKVSVFACHEILSALKTKQLDLGFVESPPFDEELHYTLWQEDELVLCAKNPLPTTLHKEDFKTCRLVCPQHPSQERRTLEAFLKAQGIALQDFHTLSQVDNPTAIIQSIKWSRTNAPIRSVALVSKLAIEHELQNQSLYASSIEHQTLKKKLYIVQRLESHQTKKFQNLIQRLVELTHNCSDGGHS